MAVRAVLPWAATVALLAEGVGRNHFPALPVIEVTVALLAEGVGRNMLHGRCTVAFNVALLAEGVGRNLHFSRPDKGPLRSPSSLRAWVEIRTNSQSPYNR